MRVEMTALDPCFRVDSGPYRAHAARNVGAVEPEMIAALGCDFHQGYLLARPITGEQLAGQLRQG